MGPSSHLENPLRDYLECDPAPCPMGDTGVDAEGPPTSNASQSRLGDALYIHRRAVRPINVNSPLSGPHHSPYFGYPVLNGTPTLRHGRRRKRDLLRTLAGLFWSRWHKPIGVTMAVVAVIAICTMSYQLRLGSKTQGRALKMQLRGLIRYCWLWHRTPY